MRDEQEIFEGLDAKRQKALSALLSQPTVADAAKKSKLSEATLFRYLSEEDFRAAYRRARAEVVNHAITQLQRDAATASRTLREICEDKTAPATARVSAAKTILDGAVKAVEIQDLAARLEEVERRLAEADEGEWEISGSRGTGEG